MYAFHQWFSKSENRSSTLGPEVVRNSQNWFSLQLWAVLTYWNLEPMGKRSVICMPSLDGWMVLKTSHNQFQFFDQRSWKKLIELVSTLNLGSKQKKNQRTGSKNLPYTTSSLTVLSWELPFVFFLIKKTTKKNPELEVLSILNSISVFLLCHFIVILWKRKWPRNINKDFFGDKNDLNLTDFNFLLVP